MDKTSENFTDQRKSQKIHASMENMHSNEEKSRIYFGESLQPTNWILDSGATCNTTLEIQECILGSLVETDKYIEVLDGHFVTANQIGRFKIKMRDSNGNHSIATLYNVLLSPDLCCCSKLH